MGNSDSVDSDIQDAVIPDLIIAGSEQEPVGADQDFLRYKRGGIFELMLSTLLIYAALFVFTAPMISLFVDLDTMSPSGIIVATITARSAMYTAALSNFIYRVEFDRNGKLVLAASFIAAIIFNFVPFLVH